MGTYSEQCDVQANGGRVMRQRAAQLSLLFLCTTTGITGRNTLYPLSPFVAIISS